MFNPWEPTLTKIVSTDPRQWESLVRASDFVPSGLRQIPACATNVKIENHQLRGIRGGSFYLQCGFHECVREFDKFACIDTWGADEDLRRKIRAYEDTFPAFKATFESNNSSKLCIVKYDQANFIGFVIIGERVYIFFGGKIR